MKIHLLCVGKPRGGPACKLHDDYAQRIERLGVRYQTAFVPDVKPGGRFTVEHALDREGALLLERAGEGGTLVALGERGELLDSRSLAARIERWATPRLTLLVGGPSGLHPSILERASSTWSLSPLTFPHELVRALVAEQLYRALTILRGIPYHK